MKVGNIEIQLMADVARLARDMAQARNIVSSTMGQIERAVNAAKAAFAATALGLSVASFATWIKGAVDATDAVNDLSAKTGVAIGDVAGLQLAFQQGGASSEAFETSMAKLSKAIVHGNDGLDAIGIKTKDVNGQFLSNREVLYSVADVFAELEDGAQKTALAQDIFGKSGAELIPLLNDGSEGLRQMDDMARKLGLTLNDETVAQAAQFNDTLDLVKAGSDGIARGIAAELLPTLSSLAGSFLEAMTEGDRLRGVAQFLATTLKILYSIALGVIEVFSMAGKTIGAAAAQVVAILNGDFALAKNIGKEWAADMGASWASTAKAISSAWDDTGSSVVSSVVKLRHGAVVQGDEAKKSAEEARKEYESAVRQAEQFVTTLKNEREQIGLTEDQVKMLTAARAAAKAPTSALREKIMEEALSLLVAGKAWKEKTDAEEAAARATQMSDEALYDATKAVWDQVDAMRVQVQQYGLTTEQVLRLKLAKLDAALVAAEGDEKQIAALNLQIQGTRELIGLAGELRTKQETSQFWTDLESTARQTFMSIENGSKGLWTRTKEAAKNIFFDWLYQQTLKKWIINVGVSAGATGGIFAEAAAANGASGVSGGANISAMATNLFSLLKSGGAEKAIAESVQSVFDQLGLSPSSGAPGEIAQFAGKAGSTLGGYFLGSSINSLISGQYEIGKGGMFVEKIATALSSYIAGPLGGAVAGAVSGLVNRVFGMGPKKVSEQGITGSFGPDGFMNGESYVSWSQKGGWLRSDKSGTDRSAMEAELARTLNDSYNAIRVSTAAFAVALGLPTDTITSYTKELKLVLTGDAAKDQEAISNLFVSMGDEMANSLIPNLADFTKEGESASGALQRLAGVFKATDAWLLSIGESAGQVFGATGFAAAKVRERLVDMAGGIEAFAAQSQYFTENFLSLVERVAPVQQQVAEKMSELGYAAVATNEQFKQALQELVSSGALATEEGARTYTALLALAPAFKTVADALQQEEEARVSLEIELMQLQGNAAGALAAQRAQELAQTDASLRALKQRIFALEDEKALIESVREAADTLMGGVDAAFSALRDAVQAEKDVVAAAHEKTMERLQSRIDSVTASIGKLKALSDSLHSALDGMSLPGQELQERAAAQERIRTALATARLTGALPDADSLKQALSVVSRDASGQFATMEEYLRDYYHTRNDIDELADITDSALTVEEKALSVLEEQKRIAEEAYLAEIARLDAMLKQGQDAIDALRGLNSTLLSVAQALAGLQGALAAAQANPVLGATGAINQAYQSALGRAPDAAGLAYWQDRAATGVPIGTIVDGIKNSNEAQIKGLYHTLLGRDVDATGYQFWMNSLNAGTSIDTVRQQIMQSQEYQSKSIPGFASGGMHAGGWRIVGENGPELEATGPARIWNGRQLAGALRGGGGLTEALLAELRQQREENAAMRRSLEAHLYAIAKNTMQIANIQDDWDTVGQPGVRAE